MAAGFFGVACGGIGLAQEEVEIVVLRAFEFSLAEVVGIYQTFLEQTDCLGVVALGKGLLCKLHAGELILAGDLSLATFPGVEDAVVNYVDCLGVRSGEVECGGLLEYEVVAHLDEVGVAFHQFQTAFGVGLHALKQLNQLHEYARVGGIE